METYPKRLDLDTGTVYSTEDGTHGTFLTGSGRLVWTSQADGTLSVSCDAHKSTVVLPGLLEEQLAVAHQYIFGCPPTLGAF